MRVFITFMLVRLVVILICLLVDFFGVCELVLGTVDVV